MKTMKMILHETMVVLFTSTVSAVGYVSIPGIPLFIATALAVL